MKLTHTQLLEGIVVISTFDGMACGLLALKRAGIKVKRYYASEIDKAAMQIALKNHPEIIHIGDITKVYYKEGVLVGENGMYEEDAIDLLIGGSPCQGFSFAGKQLNFEDPRSRLFFEFVRLKEECRSKGFLLENVRMKQASQDVITEYLGVEPEPINSSLFSAQSRPRLYWTNILINKPFVKCEYVLKDILQPADTIPAKFFLSEKAQAYMNNTNEKFFPNGKNRWSGYDNKLENKAYCLTANMHKGVPYGAIKELLRRLTLLECERLQTLPDNYTEGVADGQRYKMIGNGWTVEVIAHIFKGMLPAYGFKNIKLK